MRVYVDQPECTGAGYCEQVADRVFQLTDLGLATVRGSDGAPLADGGVPDGARVRDADVPAVHDAIGMCPGACIHTTDAP